MVKKLLITKGSTYVRIFKEKVSHDYAAEDLILSLICVTFDSGFRKIFAETFYKILPRSQTLQRQ
jgi:hypothetical protein